MRSLIRTIVLATFLSVLALPVTSKPSDNGSSDGVAPLGQRITGTSPLARLEALSLAVEGLADSGQLSSRKARSLQKKLLKVRRALTSEPARGDRDDDDDGGRRGDDDECGLASDFAVQQFVGDVGAAIRALLDFIRELTTLVTDLPSEVLQPLIDAAIGLLQELVELLLG